MTDFRREQFRLTHGILPSLPTNQPTSIHHKHQPNQNKTLSVARIVPAATTLAYHSHATRPTPPFPTNPSLVKTRILRRPGRMAGWLLSWVCVPPARTVPATCNTPRPSSRGCGFLHLLSALLLGTGNDTHQSLHTLDPSDEPHLSPM